MVRIWFLAGIVSSYLSAQQVLQQEVRQVQEKIQKILKRPFVYISPQSVSFLVDVEGELLLGNLLLQVLEPEIEELSPPEIQEIKTVMKNLDKLTQEITETEYKEHRLMSEGKISFQQYRIEEARRLQKTRPFFFIYTRTLKEYADDLLKKKLSGLIQRELEARRDIFQELYRTDFAGSSQEEIELLIKRCTDIDDAITKQLKEAKILYHSYKGVAKDMQIEATQLKELVYERPGSPLINAQEAHHKMHILQRDLFDIEEWITFLYTTLDRKKNENIPRMPEAGKYREKISSEVSSAQQDAILLNDLQKLHHELTSLLSFLS